MASPVNPPSANDQAPVALQRLAAWVSVAENRAKFARYLRFVQIGAGILFRSLGWLMGKTQYHLIRSGVQTIGHIVGYKQRTFRSNSNSGHSSSSTGFMPLVEYRLGDSTVRFEDWLGST